MLPSSPLALSGLGSFHVGGRTVIVDGEPPRTAQVTPSTSITWDPNGHYAVEGAYVQWFRPAAAADRRPVLLVHGGGMTGATWETTPDGRPGWLELLLRRGFPVFNVDNVERGRAGWCALPGVWPDAPVARSAEWAWDLFRIGPPDGFAARTPFPGQRFPVDAFDAFVRGFVPRFTSTGPAQAAALQAAIERIGPLHLICHSQGGEAAFVAAGALPALVRSVVALEPSGFGPGPAAATLTVIGDFWHAPAAAERRRQIEAFARSRPGAELWDLAAQGAPGHSHMLMMDRGSEAVCERVADWLESR